MRKSIFTFLQHYQYFTTVALLAFPFSASILLAQKIIPSSSLVPIIHSRLHTLFDAAGFPQSLQFFSILNLKLSQTITSSILVLPFTLSFLLFTKASIIQYLTHQKPSPQPLFPSLLSLFNPLLLTQLCNFLLILSANATCFSLLFVAFNCLDGFSLSSPTSLLFLSATGVVFYSIILASALMISNLALISSGVDKYGGYIAILKACVLIRGRTSTALSLALPINLAMAAVEALFQFRVVRAYYYEAKNPTFPLPLEGMFIAYLYSILIVLDTIVGCMFFKSCKTDFWLDQEGSYSFCIEIGEEARGFANVKVLKEFP